MRLKSPDGQSFSLKIISYEFPHIEDDEYDANWLDIEIAVTHPRGDWTVRDPSLLTFEVKELADWLGSLARGEQVEPILFFIEPNLGFEIDAGTSLRVNFNAEARPPWAYDSQEDVWVRFPLAEIDLNAASQALTEQLRHFPTRSP